MAEINHSPAFRADQVMVVLRGPSHQVVPSGATGVYFADQPQFSQYLDSPVDCDQAGIRILPAYPVMDFGRCQVLATAGDYTEHGAPLTGELEVVLPEYAGHFLLCKPHIVP